MVSSFTDKTPKGFGLLQRDRKFESYHDDVREELRPNLWIEPLGDWGDGAVELVEIPTADEYHDNIVAFWTPLRPARSGEAFHFSYRLHWGVKEPLPGRLARCIATRLTKGGLTAEDERVPGWPILQRRFVVEFDGLALEGHDATKATAILTMSRGSFDGLRVSPEANGNPRPWRVLFRVFADGDEPVEMRLFLKTGTETLSETWAYQYHPNAWV